MWRGSHFAHNNLTQSIANDFTIENNVFSLIYFFCSGRIEIDERFFSPVRIIFCPKSKENTHERLLFMA